MTTRPRPDNKITDHQTRDPETPAPPRANA